MMSNLDPHYWKPLSISAVAGEMEGANIPWWIAGGFAFDLHVRRSLREHKDTDVAILRRDHLSAQSFLSQRWRLFKTNQPGLAPWPIGDSLPRSVSDIWLRRDSRSPWAFQIMLDESDGENWLYRRHPEIRCLLQDIIAHTSDGIPYLRPEVQLLYKGGRSARRDKDFVDLQMMLPFLASAEIEWLCNALKMQFPQGHQWLDYLG